MDDLDLPESVDFDLDNRDSINVYDRGASPRGNHACKAHRRVDCRTCFDWKAIITAEAQEAASREKWLEKRKKWMDRVDP